MAMIIASGHAVFPSLGILVLQLFRGYGYFFFLFGIFHCRCPKELHIYSLSEYRIIFKALVKSLCTAESGIVGIRVNYSLSLRLQLCSFVAHLLLCVRWWLGWICLSAKN